MLITSSVDPVATDTEVFIVGEVRKGFGRQKSAKFDTFTLIAGDSAPFVAKLADAGTPEFVWADVLTSRSERDAFELSKWRYYWRY